MPTKHIDDATWRKVEKEVVKAVIATKKGFKDAEIIKILLNKGIEEITEQDYINHSNRSK
ncbi:hypothetical protein [Colwellia sp. E2M01]|uniref:hypothetical protein n=1 Tax=Colwellia sp. E2M01 TaxID=2841561 RepID=UPI001C080A8A|nr:hypothetical protein [Colwellia sp. E2M01]MBU2871527.1 hypothetical protein [Colwellia sp. E2M01]